MESLASSRFTQWVGPIKILNLRVLLNALSTLTTLVRDFKDVPKMCITHT